MLALCSMLSGTYYAHNYASIIGGSLLTRLEICADTQCTGNRTGLQCGQCPPGLSAVFGSFKCKKCSNDMLWLLPVFFIAGILLVFCLFTLRVNLTVVVVRSMAS